ncbi:hypothetical protein [Mycobacterium sp. URHB0044]|uniref:hypothetical protein n=1 Tax=Mycobacterium sp. URHB0044 TaxID=1380386 RepID=UPI0005687A0F|nr:hypothetical protein [Mycobacterium sp. URHB0044]
MTQTATRTALALAALAFAALAGSGIASASPDDSVTMTVDGVDYPVCAMEDCSDQPGQVGLWINDGHTWLELGEAVTLPVNR